MIQSDSVTLVQRQLEAYNRRDLETFTSCFHSDVVVTSLPDGNVTCAGLSEFRSRYRQLFESSPELHCELKSRVVLDNTVIDEEWISGASKYPNGLRAVAIYGFGDGLINRVWFPK